MHDLRTDPRWLRRIIDVCSLRRPGQDVMFKIPKDDTNLLKLVERRYPDARIDIHENTLKVPHASFDPRRGKHEKGFSHCFFQDGVLIVPECDDPEGIIKEHREKVNIITAFKRSPRHCVISKVPGDIDYIIDPTTWFYRNTDPSIIPKVFFSSVPDDVEMSKTLEIRPFGFSFKKCTDTAYKRCRTTLLSGEG